MFDQRTPFGCDKGLVAYTGPYNYGRTRFQTDVSIQRYQSYHPINSFKNGQGRLHVGPVVK